MKIHIYYRHYNISRTEPRRPEWFDYQDCYDNLLTSLPDWDSPLYKVNVIYDGNNITDNWISDFSNHSYHEIKAGSDLISFQETCNIIKNDPNIKDGDLIYFLENDYMHIPGWLDKVFELFKTYNGLDYISLYDHNDKYFLPMYDDLASKIFTTKSHHWRTTPSTCGSFILTKELFDKDYDILSTMEGDHNKWLWLNEHRGRTVITPIPGLSTHCMEGLESPTINWSKI
jgi:hypothetical protein